MNKTNYYPDQKTLEIIRFAWFPVKIGIDKWAFMQEYCECYRLTDAGECVHYDNRIFTLA